MKSIYNIKLNELENYFINNGGKRYQAAQVFDWLYNKKVTDFKLMSNLNKQTIELLNSNYNINQLKIIKKQSEKLAHKYLFELNDGSLIEAVLMRHDYGNSVCVSSQVGCNMGCLFCESGKLPKVMKRLLNVRPLITMMMVLILN